MPIWPFETLAKTGDYAVVTVIAIIWIAAYAADTAL